MLWKAKQKSGKKKVVHKICKTLQIKQPFLYVDCVVLVILNLCVWTVLALSCVMDKKH